VDDDFAVVPSFQPHTRYVVPRYNLEFILHDPDEVYKLWYSTRPAPEPAMNRPCSLEEEKAWLTAQEDSRDCLDGRGALFLVQIPAWVCTVLGYSVTRGGCQLSPFKNVQLSHIRPLVRTLMEPAPAQAELSKVREGFIFSRGRCQTSIRGAIWNPQY